MELLPCPFCDSTVDFGTEEEVIWISCLNSDCPMYSVKFMAENNLETFLKWNNRPEILDYLAGTGARRVIRWEEM